MAVKFLNIRTKEVRTAITEPQIAALWSSSDHSPNITQGQDFGWRLAPEVVVEMDQIMQDPRTLERIASRYAIPFESVNETVVLQYISDMTPAEEAPVAEDGDYTEMYHQSIQKLKAEEADPAANRVKRPRKSEKTNSGKDATGVDSESNINEE